MNGGIPFFTQTDFERGAFEEYSPLDSRGRCGVAFALVGPETMPTGERGSIGMIRPSGWQTVRYDWIDGQYLYNRCHLIGYLLTGQNDNALNLITGTRSLNTQGMLPYEERVASYVEGTGNHVLYRSTPVFEADELVARGVLMEAQSVEDGGAGIRFCAWCYNAEPGVEIDYATGESRATGEKGATGESDTTGESQMADASAAEAPGGAAAAAAGVVGAAVGAAAGAGESAAEPVEQAEPAPAEEHAEPTAVDVQTYVLNTNTHKFHYPWCSSVGDMAEKNKQYVDSTHDEVVASGFQPCKRCNP